ncbi:hypothetical protein ACFFGH_06560 [Lysobacter korlensis]|uniref:Uncharacterized protein n=1 Tax=Lysobacter korlensis TaxID=553636 RepID=A0ABV6RKJ5_9GAMM
MPHRLVMSAAPPVVDAIASTATLAVPLTVSGWMLLGHPVEDWVLLGTVGQLCLTLPYWVWRIAREWRQARKQESTL